MHHYGDNDWHGGGHAAGLHWIIPLIILLLLIGGIVWLIVRGSCRSGAAAGPPPFNWPVPPPGGRLHRPGDPALTALRLRYARGEVSRDDYLRIAADLGDVDALSRTPAPPPPPGAPRPAE